MKVIEQKTNSPVYIVFIPLFSILSFCSLGFMLVPVFSEQRSIEHYTPLGITLLMSIASIVGLYQLIVPTSYWINISEMNITWGVNQVTNKKVNKCNVSSILIDCSEGDRSLTVLLEKGDSLLISPSNAYAMKRVKSLVDSFESMGYIVSVRK